jgi:hypothetical protein
LDFKSYSADELGQIMQVHLKNRGQKITDEAFKSAVQKLSAYKNSCPKGLFGNGRTVRSMIEQARQKMAVRLQKDGSLRNAFGTQGQKRKNALELITTITLADIQAIDLNKLSGEKAVQQSNGNNQARIGFGANIDYKRA